MLSDSIPYVLLKYTIRTHQKSKILRTESDLLSERESSFSRLAVLKQPYRSSRWPGAFIPMTYPFSYSSPPSGIPWIEGRWFKELLCLILNR
jgi:hypothetical protein